jgi:hypothetical protein
VAKKRPGNPPSWMVKAADFGFPLALLFAFSIATIVLYGQVTELRAGCEAQAEAMTWPEAPGRVVDTRIEIQSRARSTTYRAGIRYVYETPLGPQGGSTIRLDESPWSVSESEAEAVRRKYPAGTPVRVRYHPSRMHISLIDATPPRWTSLWWMQVAMWVSVVFWLACVGYSLRTLIRWLRTPRNASTRKDRSSNRQTRTPEVSIVGLGGAGRVLALLFLSAAVFFLSTWTDRLQAACELQASVANWPEAPGRIVDGSISEYQVHSRYGSRTKYRAEIRYIMETPNGPVGGSTIRFDEDLGYDSKDEAKQMISRYPPGLNVMVKHHPESPGVTLLDGSAPRWNVLRKVRIGMWTATVLWALTAAFIAYRIARWLSRRRQETIATQA